MTRDEDTASTFGRVKQQQIHIDKKDILFISNDEAYRKLVADVLLAKPGVNFNVAMPDYIRNMGYRAVEMSPEIDPLGGIAIVDQSLIPKK